MREIKFRAWDGKEMWTGFHLLPAGIIVPTAYKKYKGQLEYMQYTGLKDKNGVEIYERDILSATYAVTPAWTQEQINEIKAQDPHVMLGLREVPYDAMPERTEYREVKWDDEWADWDLPRDYDSPPDLNGWSVAGNIYENPELLHE